MDKYGTGATNIADTGMNMNPNVKFDAQKSGLRYTFELPAQKHKVVLGFKNPWSARTVNIQLEGSTVHDSLMLNQSQLVEHEYAVAVSDGNLNVMIHTPYRTSRYADPILSYIIVKSMPAQNAFA